MSVDVFVLAAPGRDQAHAKLRASLAESDIGERYTWCEHPAGITKEQHWSATFDRMALSSGELVLMLEDDALVNRHILYNVETWPWTKNARFGAGWLYSPGAYLGGKDCWFSGRSKIWCGTVGVLYRRKDVLRIRDVALSWMRDRGNGPWDLAIPFAIHYLGKKIRQHGPPLVEHQWDAPSKVGNALSENWWHGSTRGKFQKNWRRDVTSQSEASIRREALR